MPILPAISLPRCLEGAATRIEHPAQWQDSVLRAKQLARHHFAVGRQGQRSKHLQGSLPHWSPNHIAQLRLHFMIFSFFYTKTSFDDSSWMVLEPHTLRASLRSRQLFRNGFCDRKFWTSSGPGDFDRPNPD